MHHDVIAPRYRAGLFKPFGDPHYHVLDRLRPSHIVVQKHPGGADEHPELLWRYRRTRLVLLKDAVGNGCRQSGNLSHLLGLTAAAGHFT
ncbi:hypothetical protein [Methylobacterium tardum]|uniref:hypothetical protein n=1 Tax=Methylobacterium tardum TaxID=374432 RepID=UPI001EDE086F|nr:hypothetical protein [Methylobacterium tardum]URD39653.1 hypothetical protein M6G65_15430 [Methylobacterium tardum]